MKTKFCIESICQGLVIMEGETESHYNIHTALLNAFFNDSYAILILKGYMMALN